MNSAKLQNLLAQMMYKDTATVSRLVADASSVVDDYAPSIVYSDIPCKLSQYGKELEQHQEARAYVLTTDLRLCLSPEYTIKPNDWVEVTHQGQVFKMHAGQAFVYPTHQEVPLRKKSDA